MTRLEGVIRHVFKRGMASLIVILSLLHRRSYWSERCFVLKYSQVTAPGAQGAICIQTSKRSSDTHMNTDFLYHSAEIISCVIVWRICSAWLHSFFKQLRVFQGLWCLMYVDQSIYRFLVAKYVLKNSLHLSSRESKWVSWKNQLVESNCVSLQC